MRSILVALAVSAVLAAVIGCAPKQQQAAAPTSTPSAAPEKAPPAPVAPAARDRNATVQNSSPTTKKDLSIGIAMTWGHPYWQNMITGFKDEAKAQEQKRGIKIDLIFNNAEEDAAKQIDQCQTLVSQGVDAVVMVPVQEEASVRAVWLLNDASIPVILDNRQIRDKTGKAKWVCYTGTDTYDGAKVSAELLMKALGGQGDIVELQQVLGSGPQIARSQALQDVLKDYPKVKLISQQSFGSDESKAVSIMQDLLKAHPEIKGVYPHGDNAAIYALKACEAAGRKDIKIVGMGGNKDALAAIKAGRMVGTSYQQPYEEGRMGLRCALAWLFGEKVKVYDPTPVRPVTQANCSQFKAQF
jgi:ABC-type sugar transport system substrate-binding protein